MNLWDAAGRLTVATVFTLTTHFTYTGDGTRVALEVEGVGVTEYIPDQGGRILVEDTGVASTRYLYGHECLGEVRDGVLLYYLADGAGYVRQSTDADGEVMDAWLYTPDGSVMAGPEGPVSHLVCGGVYDWSTGLIHKGGRYFDPTLGIWLALGVGVVAQGSRERRRKGRRGMPWYVLVLVVGVGMGGVLTACYQPCPNPEHPVYCDERGILPDPLPKLVSSEKVTILPVHGPQVDAQGGLHWPCQFSLQCIPQVGGQFIQEVKLESSDKRDYDVLKGIPGPFWESWPVSRGAYPPWTWRIGYDPFNQDLQADDAFSIGDSDKPSGNRKLDATVKFFYIPTWPLPGWEPSIFNPNGAPRTFAKPAFWDSGVGTSHTLHIDWDDTVSGYAEYDGQYETLQVLEHWR